MYSADAEKVAELQVAVVLESLMGTEQITLINKGSQLSSLPKVYML